MWAQVEWCSKISNASCQPRRPTTSADPDQTASEAV